MWGFTRSSVRNKDSVIKVVKRLYTRSLLFLIKVESRRVIDLHGGGRISVSRRRERISFHKVPTLLVVLFLLVGGVVTRVGGSCRMRPLVNVRG